MGKRERKSRVKLLMISDGSIRGTLSAMEYSPRISEPMIALCYQIVSNNSDDTFQTLLDTA